MSQILGKITVIFKCLLTRFIYPKSSNPDVARREFILNILLSGSLVLSFIATLTAFIGEVSGNSPKGSTLKIIIVFLIFLVGYFASRKGKSKQVSYILIIFYLAITTYSSLLFGADVPEDILTYALIIVMSGILLGSLFALLITIVTATILLVLIYLQGHHLLIVSSAWKNTSTTIRDGIVYDITLFIIALVSWLFNHEMEKALLRAKRSENALQKHNEQLEILVEKRTQELRQAQAEKLTQLYRFVEFGRGASGLFHDLITPLNIVSLNLDRLSDNSKEIKQREMKSLITTALNNTKRLENFILAARKQIQNQDELRLFLIKQEITQVIQIFNYKMKKEHIKIVIAGGKNIKTFNNPIKFNQLMMNLISNAIDAYEGSMKKEKIILITITVKDGKINITVQDRGKGIKVEYLSKIFEPLFTTKSLEKGTGIGLAISRDIIEKNFNGTIHVHSKENKGTLFVLSFPIQKPPSGKIINEII